jgi:hypothetical protein
MSFIAGPPRVLGRGSGAPLRGQLKRIAGDFCRILWQPLVPFNPRPDPPQDPPDSTTAIGDPQLAQCKAFYEGTETDRSFLEDKARSTFSIITFLVPLLTTALVYLFAHTSEHTTSRTVASVFISISFFFLIWAFISIVRAVSVQIRENLGMDSIIDVKAKTWRPYSSVFEARGLLYCGSVNAAMNGHIAEFVKGAHVLTALAVIASLGAAGASIWLLPTDDHPVKTQIVSPVAIASPALDDLKTEIARLRDSFIDDASRQRRVDALDAKIERTETLRESLASDEARRATALSLKIEELAASLKRLDDELERPRNMPTPAAPKH